MKNQASLRFLPLFCLFLFVWVALPLSAQIKSGLKAFTIDYHDEYGRSIHIKEFPNGNYVVATVIADDEGSPLALHFFDECDRPLYSFSYQYPGFELNFIDMYTDADNHLYLIAYLSVINNHDILLMKLTHEGDIIWSKKIGGPNSEFGYSLGAMPDGGCFIFGNTYSFPNQNQTKSFITHFSADGIQQFTRLYDYMSTWGRAIKTEIGWLAKNGSYTYSIKNNGEVEWVNRYNKTHPNSIPIEVEDGYLYMRWDYPSQGQTPKSIVYKLDKAGNVMWVSPTMPLTLFGGLCLLSNGNILALGRKYPTANSLQFAILDQEGDILFSKEWAPVEGEFYPYNVIEGRDKIIMIAGSLRGKGNISYPFVFKSSLELDSDCLQDLEYESMADTIEVVPHTLNMLPATFPDSSITMVKDTLDVSTNSLCEDPWELSLDLGPDTTICYGENRIIQPSETPSAVLTWNDGSQAPFINITEPQEVSATLNYCDESTSDELLISLGECPCIVSFPNAFTPNGDGDNDEFGPEAICEYLSYHLMIYNRWGKMIFESTNPDEKWQPNKLTNSTPSEVLVYVLEYSFYDRNGDIQEDLKKGDVTLLR